MGNSAYGSAWRAYAREAPSAAWLPRPLWGLVESETHNRNVLLAKFRHEVFRFAMGSHKRFHAIYFYEERTRRVKCHLSDATHLVLTFTDADIKANWCENEDECTSGAAVPPTGRLFATAWERDLPNEDAYTLRWVRRTALCGR